MQNVTNIGLKGVQHNVRDRSILDCNNQLDLFATFIYLSYK